MPRARLVLELEGGGNTAAFSPQQSLLRYVETLAAEITRAKGCGTMEDTIAVYHVVFRKVRAYPLCHRRSPEASLGVT